MDVKDIIGRLKEISNPEDIAGMARFGINTKKAFGIRIPVLRKLAREIGTDRGLAAGLWKSGYHEARILAGMVDDPEKVTERQIESWVKDFNSWDVCDLVCSDLFDKTEFAYRKAFEWSERPEEFVKRAGFVMMACLAVHDKKAPDTKLKKFLPVIVRESDDDRNFVKKAVNWALRQIGKRNQKLNAAAIKTAERISTKDSKAARWIAADALRELRSDKVRKKISSAK